MCGIAGVVWTRIDDRPNLATACRMVDVLSHRGPDDSGIYHSDIGMLSRERIATADAGWPEHVPAETGAFLGHRRLSIIDLAGGRQPLGNEDGSIQVVLNGEIYNYRELRDELKSRGHQFATDSDTEVIVHLYEEYGDRCVDRLRGMFAFAVWDGPKKRLLLARDRLGQKPVFYRSLPSGQFAFASEMKSLLQLGGISRQIDPVGLDLYLTYQYVPHGQTILSDCRRLPPATIAVVENGRFRTDRYWQPPYEPGSTPETGRDAPPGTEFKEPANEQAWCRELRERLTESVRLRMRSDVPLGAFLSGGIDSTIIAGLMQQLSNQPVHTFSIGFPVAKFDERSFAREASQHLGTQHHEQVVEPAALSILPKLVWHYDEPFSDSSAIPTMYLSQMTREHVTVAHSGDGGDELFAGYDRYKAVRLSSWLDRMPRPVRAFLTAGFWQKIPSSIEQRSFRRRLKRFVEALGQPSQRRYLRWISIFDHHRRRELLHPDILEQLDGFDSAQTLLDVYEHCASRDFVTQTTCADVLTYLPFDILNKVDVASMAYGLECRSPFLDHHVAELAARMPLRLKLRGKVGKHILIETFKDLLPPSIQARKKMGFGVPLDHWFRDELKPLLYEILLDARSLDRGWFRPEVVRRLVDEHVSAQWDHSYRLWNLLIFELWQQTFTDATTAPTGPVAL